MLLHLSPMKSRLAKRLYNLIHPGVLQRAKYVRATRSTSCRYARLSLYACLCTRPYRNAKPAFVHVHTDIQKHADMRQPLGLHVFFLYTHVCVYVCKYAYTYIGIYTHTDVCVYGRALVYTRITCVYTNFGMGESALSEMIRFLLRSLPYNLIPKHKNDQPFRVFLRESLDLNAVA